MTCCVPLANPCNVAVLGTTFELQVNDAAADADGYGLCAIGGAQLVQDVLDVDLDGFLRDEQALGDLAVAMALGDVLQHVALAFGQRFLAEVFGQVGGDVGWNTLHARMHLPDHGHQFGWRHVLEHVTACAGGQRALNLHVAFEGRQHDDPRLRKFIPNRAQRIDPARIGQSEIHQGDVGVVSSKQFDRFMAVRCLRDHFHVRLVVDDRSEAFAEHRMIVDTEHADLHDRRPSRAKAMRPGTVSSSSVPAVALLQTLKRAPIFSARSRMPGSPQWPSAPASTICGGIPRPLSRTTIRNALAAYSSSSSIWVAPAWRKALVSASRPIR